MVKISLDQALIKAKSHLKKNEIKEAQKLYQTVGTPTKIANWRQSTWNNVLFNPVSSSVEMFERNTEETWDNVFRLIAEDIIDVKNKTI